MGDKRRVPREGTARGLWKMGPPPERKGPPPITQMQVLSLEQVRMKYCVAEDKQFPGVWRAEPVNYHGRGFVFLFKGEMAKYEAAAFAKNKNRRDGFA